MRRWRTVSGLAVKWVAPARYHVTVKYLGACRPDAVGAVVDGVRRACAKAEPFKLSAARLGAFPSAAKASVLWAGPQRYREPMRLSFKADIDALEYRLEIGLPMRLVLLPVWPDSSGGDVVTYAFEPEGGAT